MRVVEDLNRCLEEHDVGIQNRDVRAPVHHDPTMVLRRTTAKTLRLAKDAHGLRVEIDAPDTTAGRDIVISVERGDVTGMSFEFMVPQGGDRFERRGDMLTHIASDAIIREVSIVTLPYLSRDSREGRTTGAAGVPA